MGQNVRDTDSTSRQSRRLLRKVKMQNVITVDFRNIKTPAAAAAHYGKKLRSMTREQAEKIINDYASENATSYVRVIHSWLDNERNGAARHLWPDVNRACQVITDYPVDANTVDSR
jgi:hypothetical protein